MKKAQAGFSLLLSIIVGIFLIGLLVTIFAFMNAGLSDTDALYKRTSGTNTAEALASVEGTLGENFAVIGFRSVTCSIINVTNASNEKLITSTNYTYSACNLKSSGGNAFNNTNWKVAYTYQFLNPTAAVTVINDTIVSTSGVTTWFPIMIVITSMVVLILLTVIIITAIRGSGMMGGGGAGGGNSGGGKGKGGGNIGTA
jgi:hypothetical protein